jgi:TRAP-type mannitol/chloroaromatic compound transport system substrate-binding protein
VLKAFRETSAEVVAEEASKDASFKEAYESLQSYIDTVGRWDSLQHLPRN